MKKVIYTLLLFCAACHSTATKEEPAPTNPTDKKLFNVPTNFPTPVYEEDKSPVTEAGFLLGRTLFYDGRLSRDGTISCGECHRQEYAFTPVSYTHLDVYKRQAWNNQFWIFSPAGQVALQGGKRST